MALQNEAQTMLALENLMNEFFNHFTSNERKRQIESQLETFSNQQDCWRLCTYFITNSDNHFVCMYALTAIESVINRQWAGLEWNSRLELRNILWSHLTQHHTSLCVSGPAFLRNKLVKLIVDIARHDWPHFYPDFFNNIVQLIESKQGHILGLILLRTASEELGGTREDLSSIRCVELSGLMQMHLGPVLRILTSLLETLAAKQEGTTITTRTPPPSPTRPSCSPQPVTFTEPPTARPDTRESSREALQAIQHIFSWMPLTDINTTLIVVIFKFANAMPHTQDDDDIRVLALTTLSEILYRKAIPPGCEQLLLQLSNGVLQLLHHIIGDSVQSGQFDSLSCSFLEKLTEMLQLLMESHLRRLETESSFSTMNFLSLLFRYTFQQSDIRQFLLCLNIWSSFIKQIKPEHVSKYSEVILAIASALLNKVQFQHNHVQLETLDTENEIGTGCEIESEYIQFRKNCIELITLITDLVPVHILEMLIHLWRTCVETYSNLHFSINIEKNGLNISNVNDQKHLHFVLSDLSTLTLTLSHLSSSFIDEDEEHYSKSIEMIHSFITQLISVTKYTMQYNFYQLQALPEQIYNDLIEIHSHLLTCISSWCLWPKLRTSLVDEHVLCEVLSTALNILVRTLDTGRPTPEVLNKAAVGLVLRLSSLVPCDKFIVIPLMRDLVQCVSQNSRFSKDCIEILRHALCNIAVISNASTNVNIERERVLLLSSLIEGILRPLFVLESNDSNVSQIKSTVESALLPLSELVIHYKHHNSSVKKLLCTQIKSPAEKLLTVYSRFAKYPEVNDHILSLYLTLLDVLRQQLGVEFTRQAVQVFLDVTLSTQHEDKVLGLDKLLQILQLIVEEPGTSFRCLLPSIIGLCLQTALPIVATHPNEYPDLTNALFKLLHSILLHRWQYFYKSQVRLGHSPGASDSTVLLNESESLQKPQEFVAILQAFGQALLQPDINTFKLSLNSLENLNTKWKLYYKFLFREQLLNNFLTVLFHTLLHKSHALLSDEIVAAIYNMASVDLRTFHNIYFPQFLNTTEGLDQHQREMLLKNFSHESDMPTFTQNVLRFVNDLRCYKLCNVSLPANSVVLSS